MASSRSESMKLIGRVVKERGHAYEVVFNSLFNKRQKHLNFSGASSDCFVSGDEILNKLKPLGVKGETVSLKASDTWQFHLGNLTELSDTKYYKNSIRQIIPEGKKKPQTWGQHNKTFDEQLKVLNDKDFWWKYLGKGDYLCYTNRKGLWRFFSMTSVIEFITTHTEWRLLDTGRIKGDYRVNIKNDKGDSSIKLYKGVITFEFRDEEHKQTFVLGAHGAKNGYKFMTILSSYIPYVDVNN
jgi:hypothetical protein